MTPLVARVSYVGKKILVRATLVNDMPKHMLIAFDEYGIKEVPGAGNNKRIVQYSADIGHSWVKDDATPWCSIFTNWVCMKAGAPRSNKLNARSWLDVGNKVTKPQFGDVVIFWRGSKTGWQGHVAFYITERDGLIYTLGGNQSDKVTISAYNNDRLLGYRRLTNDTVEKPLDIKSLTTKELLTEILLRIS